MSSIITWNRTILVLLSATLLMQGVLLYRQPVPRVAGPVSPLSDTPPDGAAIELATLAVKGSESAHVVIVEFTDYECPFCRRHAQTVQGELLKLYVDTGKVQYAVAQLPLPIHSHANLLATAAICADLQGSFWPVHQRLFEASLASMMDVVDAVNDLPLDTMALRECVETSDIPSSRIERHVQVAQELQLFGTPSFAIGYLRDGAVDLTRFVRGSQPLATFRSIIDPMVSTEVDRPNSEV